MKRLLEPMRLGNCALQHRVVMAPMTRLRADDDHVPVDMMIEYYTQRASVPGTLLITEATFISRKSRGRDPNAPGIFSPEQIKNWIRVTDAVHAKKSFIFMQIWHVGRAARQAALDKAGIEMVSSSDIPIGKDHPTPRAMTEGEIQECITSFAQAAKNAIAAGFDGVEIHAANGYLIDQFIQDVCNRRTDAWGGDVERRSRFCLEVVKAVCESIGPENTAVRLSPFSEFQGMRMNDPVPQFTYLISKLKDLGLAYLHLIEPRVSGNADKTVSSEESLDFALEAWNKAGPIVLAGGYTAAKADQSLETKFKDQPVAFAFGRHFISNPDLPYRLANDIPLAHYNRATFYKVKSSDGYVDYSFSPSWSG